MKLHLDKIINIKNMNDLNAYNIDKPIFYENYLFHYLIILDKLDILKLKRFPVYKLNEEGLDAFMLAAKYDNMTILKYLLKEYSEYAQNHNQENLNFINYLPNPEKIITLMKDFESIDWIYLFKFKNKSNMTFYSYFISILNFTDITWFLKNVSFKKFYTLNSILLNEKLTDSQKISIFDKFSDKDINDKDDENNGLLVSLIDLEDYKMAKYLINRNLDLEYIIKPISDFITPFYYLYTKLNLMNSPNLKKIMDLLESKIKLNLTFYSKEGIDYVGLVLYVISSNKLNKMEDYILKNSPDSSYNRVYPDKSSNLFLITKKPFDIYHKYLDKRKLDLTIINMDEVDEKWKSYLNKADVYKPDLNINLEQNKYQHSTKFTATDVDLMLYFIYLDQQYKNLYIPTLKNDRPNMTWHINYDDTTNILDIDPNLNLLINNSKDDYAIVFLGLTLNNQELKHANLLFYDLKNSTVERFEPYGDSGISDKLDEYLEEELTWNTGLTYLRPKDFLTKPGYQLISNEGTENLKAGDFGGFCLAWCIWYVEHRMKNIKILPKLLNQKTIEKMLHLDISFTEYIRNYSDKLFNIKFKIAKNKIKIDEKNISNLYLSKDDEYKIIKFAKEYFS